MPVSKRKVEAQTDNHSVVVSLEARDKVVAGVNQAEQMEKENVMSSRMTQTSGEFKGGQDRCALSPKPKANKENETPNGCKN